MGAWAVPERVSGPARIFWENVATQSARYQVNPARTSNAPARAWGERVLTDMMAPSTTRMPWEAGKGRAAGGVRPTLMALAHGLALPDLFAVHGALTGSAPFPHDAAQLLAAETTAGALTSLGWGLQDMIGWMLATGQDEPAQVGDAAQAAGDAVAAGLPLDGYWFVLAGLGVDEALDALAAGTIDRERARLLAGLRGVPLPAM